jgi:hypothetical protein
MLTVVQQWRGAWLIRVYRRTPRGPVLLLLAAGPWSFVDGWERALREELK